MKRLDTPGQPFLCVEGDDRCGSQCPECKAIEERERTGIPPQDGCSATPSEAMVTVREDVIRFLLGEAAFEGYWYGDVPAQLPMFWWRTPLRLSMHPYAPPSETRLTPIGDRFFEASNLASKLEWEIYELLSDMFGEGAIEDTSHDSYDTSIELYTKTDLVPTKEQADKILSWGFSRFWVNYPDETQRYYAGGDAVGDRVKRTYQKYPKNPRFAVSATATLKGWAIRHVDGRWRTMDTIGMPDWTDDPAKALVCRLREHVDAYAADDPDDVRIVEAVW